jgi:hypothetical protein
MTKLTKLTEIGFNKKVLGSILSAVLVVSVVTVILMVPEVKPAYGAVSVKMGTIPRGACSPAPCIKNYTGLGFQPKALIVFAASELHGSWELDYNILLGFSGGVGSDRSISTTSRDNVGTTVAKRTSSETYIIRETNPSSPFSDYAQAKVNKFHGDGFELKWDLVPTGAGLSWDYIAIGGGDITNVKVDTITAAAATGSKVHNVVGFKADAIIFLYNRMISNSTTGNAGLGLGFAAVNPLSNMTCNAQGALMGVSEDARDTSDTAVAQRTDKVIYQLDPSDTSAVDAEAEFEGFTHDGFVLNWTNLPADSNDKFFYMAIKGGKFDVGKLDQQTSTPPVSQNITTGFTPKGLLLASFNNAAATGIQNHNRISFGATEGTAYEVGIWTGDKDNEGTSATGTWTSGTGTSGKVIRLAVENIFGNPTLKAEAELSGFDSDGFNLNWTTTDGTAREILYFAFG